MMMIPVRPWILKIINNSVLMSFGVPEDLSATEVLVLLLIL